MPSGRCRFGSNRVHRFSVSSCVRCDGSAAGLVQSAGGWRRAECRRRSRGRSIVRVHVIVPEGFDNPGQPTGGNIYDRRVWAGLAGAGWGVRVATVAAAWPVPDPGARADLARIVSAIPDGEIALIDGLIASPTAAQLLPHAGRIRMTVLLHMPLATALDTRHDASAQRSERVVLRAATGVVVTSEWTRQQVLTRYEIPACRVHVARPGVDRVAAPALPLRGHLICVGTLGRHKGQDLPVAAPAEPGDLNWHCVPAGPRPGHLTPSGDPAALAAAIGDWLGDERHRHRLRAAARKRRSNLRGWEQTTQEIANALTAHGGSKTVPLGVNNHPGKTSGRA